ncbi:hypothetical protein [Hydrotalea sp.]|uniref:hypothetical protein n=1 Tax=Hydrotalea sp. TaxID=2881279 RepID=UPI00261E7AF0|nr:hypothetical protein [Hydrotalea sp.]
MKKMTLLLYMINVLLSCAEKESTTNSVNKDDVVLMPVCLMDSIQHLFGNENWRIISGKDTTYRYFSRQNDLQIHVYQYNMNQGDSIQCSFQTIRYTPKGIFWQQSADTFQLIHATLNSNKWIHGADTMFFRLLYSGCIEHQFKGKNATMNRTINLTDFLIRSRYDFLHGTHYADDTTKFKHSSQ